MLAWMFNVVGNWGRKRTGARRMSLGVGEEEMEVEEEDGDGDDDEGGVALVGVANASGI